jgi:uncharacterized protein YndB with AHSA1/START domain
MDGRRGSDPVKNPTTVERKSDRELVVTRIFNAPARLVFEAWTKPELFQRLVAPKSIGNVPASFEADVRTGAPTVSSSPPGSRSLVSTSR